MKSSSELHRYFSERKIYLFRRGIEVKAVYISKDLLHEVMNDYSSGICSENMNKQNHEDYTFRGVPMIQVFKENHFEVGI
tara:strand:- start:255 stop:494 length:240 start_codon:yes stop_codon:yes gene_type:complete